MQAVCGKMIEERKRQGLSQRKLAELSGVSSRSIAAWEAGKKGMTVASAEKVFGALGMKIQIVPMERRDEYDNTTISRND